MVNEQMADDREMRKFEMEMNKKEFDRRANLESMLLQAQKGDTNIGVKE